MAGRATEVLREWAAHLTDPSVYPSGRHDADRETRCERAELALAALAGHDPDGHAESLARAVDTLLTQQPGDVWPGKCLALAWGGWFEPSGAPIDLSPVQRRTVEQICDHPDVFEDRGFTGTLAWTALPNTLAGMRSLLEAGEA